MIKKKEFQVQEVSGRQHKRSSVEAFNRDLGKVLIELITNSCDSYKRSKRNMSKKEIYITYNPSKKFIKVVDNGEGVNFNKKGDEKCFKDIMKKGELTSGREKGFSTRGFHGIGLKDVCIAMENVEIASIKSKKFSLITYGYNEEKKNFGYWPIKKDVPATSKDKRKFEISDEGFYIKFKIPEEWNLPKLGQLKNKLETHRELRKIIENGDFKIDINSEPLNYDSPEGEAMDSGNFIIKWKGIDFNLSYIIKLSKYKLEQTPVFWKDRIGGILVYHSKDAVLDLTLFKFNNDPYAERIFGEVEISTKKIDDINKLLEEGVVDEKRRGLDFRKDFNEKLKKELEKRLKIIIDKEKEKDRDKNKNIVDDEESQKILKDINNLIKSEVGKAITNSKDVPDWRPIDKPFGFFPSNREVLIKEFEKKSIYIVINKDFLEEEDKEIILRMKNKKIKISPLKISIKEGSFDEDGFLLKRINLYSEEEDSFGTLVAENKKHSEEITIRVVENEKMNPEGGFAFTPNKVKIAKDKPKELLLVFNKKELKLGEKLELSLNSKEIILKKSPKKIEETGGGKLNKNLGILKIEVEGKKIGASAKISARCNDKYAECLIEIVDEREIKRKNYLEKIELSEKADPIVISKYDENEKTIWIYIKHPIILEHRKTIGEDIKISVIRHQDLILLLADVLTRELSSLIAREHNKKTIGELQIDSYTDFKLAFDKMYRQHGAKLTKFSYDLICNYLVKQIEDSDNEIPENNQKL